VWGRKEDTCPSGWFFERFLFSEETSMVPVLQIPRKREEKNGSVSVLSSSFGSSPIQ
jgi:hypothetical protein